MCTFWNRTDTTIKMCYYFMKTCLKHSRLKNITQGDYSVHILEYFGSEMTYNTRHIT